MKKSLAILLLILLSYHYVGSWMAFKALQFKARQEIKVRLKNSVPDAQLVRFHESDIIGVEWTKPNREFRLPSGDMYDVVRKEGAYYLCIHDTYETALFQYLDNWVDQQIRQDNEHDSSPHKNWIRSFKIDYFVHILHFIPVPKSIIPVDFGLYISPIWLTVESKRPCPPPEHG